MTVIQVGLPAKSAVSGGLVLVIPNVMGIGLWSPPLDQLGNSVRGVQFSKVSQIF
jgi:glutaminase